MTGLLLASFLCLAPTPWPQNPQPPAAPPPTAATPAQPPAATPAQPASKPAPPVEVGPLRLELIAMGEQRIRFVDAPPAEPPPSALHMQFRLRGADLRKVVKVGNVLFSEVTDSTGKQLVKPESYDQEKRTASRAIEINDGIIAQGGPAFVERVDASNRGATKLSAKGTLKAYLGWNPQNIVVENPLRFRGKMVESPQLDALGIKIKILGPDTPGVPDDKKNLAIQIVDGKERIQVIEHYDDWVRIMPHRLRPITGEAGLAYDMHTLSVGAFTDESHMLIKVFGDNRVDDIQIDLKDIELP